MDITSPFVVVPVMAVIFLTCIIYAGLTDRYRFDQTLPDDSNAKSDTH